MNELTPLEKKIKDLITHFNHEEPYITNTAKRIARLHPNDLIGVTPNELKDQLRKEYKLGYSNGYNAGRKRAEKEAQS